MPRQITREICQYACSECGTLYSNEDSAAECERIGKLLNSYRGYESWKWYRLGYKSSGEMEHKDFFARKVVFCNNGESCTDLKLEIYNYKSNDYFIIDGRKNWYLLEYMGILEAYEKYGLLVDPYFRLGREFRWFGTNDMPLEVAKEIDETYNLWRNKHAIEYSRLSKGELIHMLVESTLPNNIPPDFSFVGFRKDNDDDK